MTALYSFITDKSRTARQDLTVLLIVFGFGFFQFLGKIPLIDPDEGRYAEIPREMLEQGDFVTPFLNYVKYFEKPPLHYWLSAASLAVFGENEFAARLPGALMGLLTVLLVYHLGRKLFGRREGLLAALILGTSTGFLVQARIDITDMTLTCCLSGALGAFLLAIFEDEARKGLYYYLFYACAALAVLAKGLIGIVLPGGIIFFYLLLSGRWRLLKEMRFISGTALFLLIASPWFVLVSLKNPEFARFFFIHEHFERFLTKVHGRYQPIWFFIPVLIGTMLPWSFFIPNAMQGIWRERRRVEGSSRLYLAVWAILIFVFFSKSNSKLVPYILPVFPPLALLMGSALGHLEGAMPRAVKAEGYAIGGFLTILGAGAICYPFLAPRPEIAVGGALVIGGIFLCQGTAALRAVVRSSSLHLVATLLLFSFLLGIVAPPFILSGIAQKKSVKELGLVIREKAGKDAIVASYGLKQGLSFYARRRVMIVGDRNELDFGSQQGDQSAWFVDLNRFSDLWNSPAHVLLFLSEAELDSVRKLFPLNERIVARQGKRLLISNR